MDTTAIWSGLQSSNLPRNYGQGPKRITTRAGTNILFYEHSLLFGRYNQIKMSIIALRSFLEKPPPSHHTHIWGHAYLNHVIATFLLEETWKKSKMKLLEETLKLALQLRKRHFTIKGKGKFQMFGTILSRRRKRRKRSARYAESSSHITEELQIYAITLQISIQLSIRAVQVRLHL